MPLKIGARIGGEERDQIRHGHGHRHEIELMWENISAKEKQSFSKLAIANANIYRANFGLCLFVRVFVFVRSSSHSLNRQARPANLYIA